MKVDTNIYESDIFKALLEIDLKKTDIIISFLISIIFGLLNGRYLETGITLNLLEYYETNFYTKIFI